MNDELWGGMHEDQRIGKGGGVLATGLWVA